MTVGQRIKARREECGLSVIDLAERLGKARSTIYRYEGDEIQDMPITVLEPLAEALSTTPAYLMGWSDDPHDYDSVDFSGRDYQTGSFGDRLIRLMTDRAIDEEGLAAMTKMTVDEVQELMADPEPPSDDILRRLSLALSVDVPWLRGDTSVPLYYLDDDEYQVISGYRQASDDTRKAIRAILKAQ